MKKPKGVKDCLTSSGFISSLQFDASGKNIQHKPQNGGNHKVELLTGPSSSSSSQAPPLSQRPLLLLTGPSSISSAPPPPYRLSPGLLLRSVLPPHLGDGLIWSLPPPVPPPRNITACEIPAASVHSGRTVRSTVHRALEGPIFSGIYSQRWKMLKIVREETLDVRCGPPRVPSSSRMLNTALTVAAGRAQIPAAARLFIQSLWQMQESQAVFFC